MSLPFNMLSMFVIAFLPRSKCLLISWLQSPYAVILEPKKIKSVTVSIVSHLFAMNWWWFQIGKGVRQGCGLPSGHVQLWELDHKEVRAPKNGYLRTVWSASILVTWCEQMGKWMGKQWKLWERLYFWAPKSLHMVTAAMELKDTCSLEEKLWQT